MIHEGFAAGGWETIEAENKMNKRLDWLLLPQDETARQICKSDLFLSLILNYCIAGLSFIARYSKN
jgi:hypothetical protein